MRSRMVSPLCTISRTSPFAVRSRIVQAVIGLTNGTGFSAFITSPRQMSGAESTGSPGSRSLLTGTVLATSIIERLLIRNALDDI